MTNMRPSKKKKDAVVIIDMQTGFSASYKVIRNCVSLLRKAKTLDIPVVLVEFVHNGNTHKPIVKMLSKRDVLVKKKYQDGSLVVVPVLKKLRVNHVYVAGVNTDQCVHDTALGMVKSIPDLCVSLVKSACNTDWYRPGQFTLYEQGNWNDFPGRLKMVENVRYVK